MNYYIINSIAKTFADNSGVALKTIWQALGSGGQMFVFGIIAAFAFLGVLFVGTIFYKRFIGLNNSASNMDESENKNGFAEDQTNRDIDEAEIIAVIAAAIACAEAENPGVKFKVVSFKRN
jgi:Na+-transporting methylmalonyl-CoA/oxaloacetate decarboxylase gamma subunit